MPAFKFKPKYKSLIFPITTIIFAILAIVLFFKFIDLQNLNIENEKTISSLKSQLDDTINTLQKIQTEDQYLKNVSLEEEINSIVETYGQSVDVYEKLQDLRKISKNTDQFDRLFAETISLLSKRNYASASASIDTLSKEIETEKQNVAQASAPQENLSVNNAPPASGYSRQLVQTDSGRFTVSMVSADISSTRVIVDTASTSDCSDNCPVLSLSEYVARNGGYAGINGTYFCPADYPSCSDKSNSFDLLVMNKDKNYFNSSNNVYSSNPAVIFADQYIRFVSSASEWGRDTSPTGVLSNYPLLIKDSNVTFGGDSDAKQSSKGARSFVANKGNQIIIGVVHNATVAESAQVMKALGVENALNLDNGGSTALWSGGYKAGPGRNIPNAIIFVRK